MLGAKTVVKTRINKIELHAHLTHYHGHAVETIKAIKIVRGTLDAAFELNTFQILSKKARIFHRLREDTAPRNGGDRALCSNYWTVRGTLLQSTLDN